jgi:hypothetical protein
MSLCVYYKVVAARAADAANEAANSTLLLVSADALSMPRSV